MKRFAFALLVATTLASCASTQTIQAPNAATASAPTNLPTMAPTPTIPEVAMVETASMKQLGLTGERYATMGDPNAPVTMIDFSDFG